MNQNPPSPGLHASLLSEAVAEGGTYSGLFRAYGLEFAVTYTNGFFAVQAAISNPKRPNWQVEAATRLCQSAAYERMRALKLLP